MRLSLIHIFREELQGRESGGVYLTTIQKFTEDLQLLTDRTNVICISEMCIRDSMLVVMNDFRLHCMMKKNLLLFLRHILCLR